MEVTLEITQYCPWKCDYCSSMASPEGKHLDFSDIRKFLSDIIENETEMVDRINISGGEPLAHPDFFEILMLCHKIANGNVWVYTNVIPNIIYNSNVIKEMKVEANVCITPGRDIYIPETAHKVHLLKLIHQGRAKNFPECNITVSRNFWDPEHCEKCKHILIQANGKIVQAPCKKEYHG